VDSEGGVALGLKKFLAAIPDVGQKPVAHAGVNNDSLAIYLEQPRMLREAEIAAHRVDELRLQPMRVGLDVSGRNVVDGRLRGNENLVDSATGRSVA
jgi:hypothetical protein